MVGGFSELEGRVWEERGRSLPPNVADLRLFFLPPPHRYIQLQFAWGFEKIGPLLTLSGGVRAFHLLVVLPGESVWNASEPSCVRFFSSTYANHPSSPPPPFPSLPSPQPSSESTNPNQLSKSSTTTTRLPTTPESLASTSRSSRSPS